jgi:uncharacterized membrane protein
MAKSTRSTEQKAAGPKSSLWIARFVSGHRRLVVSVLLGTAVFFLLPKEGLPVPRIFFAWDAGVLSFLASVYWMLAHSNAQSIRRQSAKQDEGRNLVLIGAIGAVAFSLAVILVWLMGGMGVSQHPAIDLALVFLTIPLSWIFIHTIFMLHYAHEYYAEHRGSGGGLRFPGESEPDYWDFVYFSFGIGMAAQVSDVTVTSKPFRHIVTVHGIVSFVFNVTLIALTVSVIGDAIPGR